MSSVCGKSDHRDSDTHFENLALRPTICSDGSTNLHPSLAGSEDSQESDGDDTGYIHQSVNEDKVTGKAISVRPSPESSDEEAEDLSATLQKAFSESAPLNLIPAMKGSREKHGLSARKLRVSWAEDVYDPPPSIVSHTRGKKHHHHHHHHHQHKSKTKDNHKKSGKKGQKGSSNSSSRGSSGGGGSDKKQSSRKHSSSRDKFQLVMHAHIAAACS